MANLTCWLDCSIYSFNIYFSTKTTRYRQVGMVVVSLGYDDFTMDNLDSWFYYGNGTFEESGKDDIWPILTPWLIWAGILTLVNVGVGIWWVVWFVKKGDKGPNRFGPDPRQKRQPE